MADEFLSFLEETFGGFEVVAKHPAFPINKFTVLGPIGKSGDYAILQNEKIINTAYTSQMAKKSAYDCAVNYIRGLGQDCFKYVKIDQRRIDGKIIKI